MAGLNAEPLWLGLTYPRATFALAIVGALCAFYAAIAVNNWRKG